MVINIILNNNDNADNDNADNYNEDNDNENNDNKNIIIATTTTRQQWQLQQMQQ